MPDDESDVKTYTPEEFIEEVKRQASAAAAPTLPVEPPPGSEGRYVQFGFGAGHDFMLNLRFHESQLDRVFYWTEKFFARWISTHVEDAEPGSTIRGPMGVPYHG